MKLILARHGETDYNKKKLCPTDDVPTLTALGIKQARILGEYVAVQGVDAIFCSPSRRTRETLEVVLKKIKAPFFIEPLISERSSGVWEGRPLDDATKCREMLGLAKHEFRPKGGENYIDVDKRAGLFWEKIKHKYNGKTVLIISHSAFNNILAARLLGYPIEKTDMGLQDNCAVHEMIIEDGKAKAVRINHNHMLDSFPDDA